MEVVIEKRDILIHSFKKDNHGTSERNQLVNNPLLSIDGRDMDNKSDLIEHVRVAGKWFVLLPEKEQERLQRKWESLGEKEE